MGVAVTPLAALAALGCAETEGIIVLGEVRDPETNCEASLVEYEFKVRVDRDTQDYLRQDWCAVMGAASE